MSARLLAYRWPTGNEPDGEVIVICGSPACLNPKHLALPAEKPFLLRDKRMSERVKVGSADECWPWQGYTAKGYGFLSMGRKCGLVAAHRIAWEIANGPVPEGLFVKQRCGNQIEPRCRDDQDVLIDQIDSDVPHPVAHLRRGLVHRRQEGFFNRFNHFTVCLPRCA